MAYIQINFYSEQLKRSVPVSAFIPNDMPMEYRSETYDSEPMKTLYLLPGYAGNHQDWILNATLQDLSNRYHMAIISSAGENSFYVDRVETGFAYGTYVGEELVAYTRKLFHLSEKREDTYIGGYSMGGFGALRNGLKYSQTFSKIIALSSALIIHELPDMKPGMNNGIANYEYYHTTFGDLKEAETSDKNPEYLVMEHLKSGQPLPDIYMACGSEDFLIEHNRAFVSFLKAQQVEVLYEEEPGTHNWDFWNPHIVRGMDWIIKGC